MSASRNGDCGDTKQRLQSNVTSGVGNPGTSRLVSRARRGVNSRPSDQGERRYPIIAVISYLLLLVGGVTAATVLLAGCGTPATTNHSPAISAGVTVPSGTAPPSPVSVNAQVGEAEIGSAHVLPGTVTVSAATSAFAPPDFFPVYVITSAGYPEREAMDAQATRLGLGEERTYGTAGVSDGRWRLVFHRGDIECFTLTDVLYGEKIAQDFEERKARNAPVPETAREIADAYLRALGYLEGLEFSGTFIRESFSTSGPGGTEYYCAPTIGVSYRAKLEGIRLVGVGVTVDVGPDGQVVGLSHTLQDAERAGEVRLRPLRDALADLRAGEGTCPVQASPDALSNITVEAIEIAYYGPPEAVSESHYKPIYVFHLILADGTAGEWLISAFDAEG